MLGAEPVANRPERQRLWFDSIAFRQTWKILLGWLATRFEPVSVRKVRRSTRLSSSNISGAGRSHASKTGRAGIVTSTGCQFNAVTHGAGSGFEPVSVGSSPTTATNWGDTKSCSLSLKQTDLGQHQTPLPNIFKPSYGGFFMT